MKKNSFWRHCVKKNDISLRTRDYWRVAVMRRRVKTAMKTETIVIEDDERYDYVNLRGPSSTTQPLFHRLYVIIWARLLFNSV
jgi:hypothetical protein